MIKERKMNAIEIRDLSKSFRGMYAVDHLDMTVPQGAIYGFIGENGSGKSTTEKLICGHLVPDGGEIRLFGREHTDPGVRVRVGALIENAGSRNRGGTHSPPGDRRPDTGAEACGEKDRFCFCSLRRTAAGERRGR